MRNHFEDSWYHLVRAVEHAKWGLEAELERVEARVRTLMGREPEPEPNRLQRVRAATAARKRVITERARRGLEDVRNAVFGYRARSRGRERST
ncbi:DUF7553 family protein [Natronococcus wangiae]